jgi:hypothetical protein
MPAEVDTSQADPLFPPPQIDPVVSRRHSEGAAGISDRLTADNFIGPALSNDQGPCVPDCRCTCHFEESRRNSTQSVRTSIAPFASRFGYGSFTRKCSISECSNKRRNRGQIKYSFPSRHFRQIITISILYEGLKFRSYLDIPTYVPDFSDVIRAALTGDISTFKRLFHAGIARKNDTGLDGWTTLHVSAISYCSIL